MQMRSKAACGENENRGLEGLAYPMESCRRRFRSVSKVQCPTGTIITGHISVIWAESAMGYWDR